MKLSLAFSAVILVSSIATAMAQEDTTTTTTTTTVTPPAHGAYIGVPGVAGVEVGGRPGCVSRSKTVTDQDTGESHTVRDSSCD
jgi:hypothetical protein